MHSSKISTVKQGTFREVQLPRLCPPTSPALPPPMGNRLKMNVWLLCVEWINTKVLLYSTGNYIQSLVINHNGKEYKKEYICITESICCTAEINTTL